MLGVDRRPDVFGYDRTSSARPHDGDDDIAGTNSITFELFVLQWCDKSALSPFETIVHCIVNAENRNALVGKLRV